MARQQAPAPDKPLDHVLVAIHNAIRRPDMSEFWRSIEQTRTPGEVGAETRKHCGVCGCRLGLFNGRRVIGRLQFTAKLCGRGEVAAYVPFPAWLATILHDPFSIMVAVVPDTVQMLAVEEEKLTKSPELAAADKVREAPTACGGMVGKVMA